MTRAALVAAGTVLFAGLLGCSVPVASLQIAIPRPVSPDRLRTARSRGSWVGESCRLWLVAIPLGLPQVDDAIEAAIAPAHGVFMRNVIVYSAHPTYGLFGWHCYRVRGEVFG